MGHMRFIQLTVLFILISSTAWGNECANQLTPLRTTNEIFLFKSIELDNLEYFNKLVEDGTNINIVDDNGNTPLMYSIESSKPKFALNILRNFWQKINLNHTNNDGFKAVDLALNLLISQLIWTEKSIRNTFLTTDFTRKVIMGLFWYNGELKFDYTVFRLTEQNLQYFDENNFSLIDLIRFLKKHYEEEIMLTMVRHPNSNIDFNIVLEHYYGQKIIP